MKQISTYKKSYIEQLRAAKKAEEILKMAEEGKKTASTQRYMHSSSRETLGKTGSPKQLLGKKAEEILKIAEKSKNPIKSNRNTLSNYRGTLGEAGSPKQLLSKKAKEIQKIAKESKQPANTRKNTITSKEANKQKHSHSSSRGVIPKSSPKSPKKTKLEKIGADIVKYGGELMDGVQFGLETTGLIPVVGIAPDAINAGIHVLRGNTEDANWSIAAMIPISGIPSTLTKATKGARGTAKGIGKGLKKTAKEFMGKGVTDGAVKIIDDSIDVSRKKIEKFAEIKPKAPEGGKPPKGKKKIEKPKGTGDGGNGKKAKGGLGTEGNGKGVIKSTPELESHIKYTDPTVARKRGIGGAHNADEFFKNDLQVVSRRPHPNVEGVEIVEYQLPKLDKTGTPIPGEYQSGKPFSKTIYNPKIMSDERYIKRGIEACNNALSTSKDGILPRVWTGADNQGTMWRGYYEDGIITSFYPE